MTRTIGATFSDGTNLGTYYSHVEITDNATLHDGIFRLQRNSEPHHDRLIINNPKIFLIPEIEIDTWRLIRMALGSQARLKHIKNC
jgi:hypothetical protein